MADDSFDFYNPVLAVTIETPDGERFPLWTKQSETALRGQGLQGTSALAWVTEVTVELQLAYLPIIKVTLTPPYAEGLAFLDSKLVEWGQSTLEVICGYVGVEGTAVLSQPYRGVLLKPDITLGKDITIILNAQGVGGFGAIRQEANTQFNNATRYEILKALAGRYKLDVDAKEVEKVRSNVQFSPTSLLNVDVRGVVEARHFFDERIVFAQGGRDYWTCILQLVNEAGCHMFLNGSTIKVIPSSFVFSSAPVRVFSVFSYPEGRIGPKAGVFPITSASSPTSAVYLPGSSRGFLVQDISSDFREEIRKFIGDKQVNSPRTNEGASTIVNDATLPAVDEATGEGAEMYPGSPSDAQLVAQVEAEYNAQTTLMGVQLDFESFGDPRILPGHTVAVRGLGQRLDGAYSVLKATYTLGASSFTMKLDTVSNVGTGLANAVRQFGPSAPPPSPDLPEEQGKVLKVSGSI